MPVQSDVYMDPATGDLPEVSRFTTGIELVEQRIRLRLRRGVGEWFLDPGGTGLPLIEWREAKPPDVAAIVSRVQTEIREIPGVSATKNFDGVHDSAARRLTISGDVLVDVGSVTTIVISAPTDPARNTFLFQIFFTRGSGPIVRPSPVFVGF